MTPRQEKRDYCLLKEFGFPVLKQTEEERESLYSFCMAISYMAKNKRNLEFNQP